MTAGVLELVRSAKSRIREITPMELSVSVASGARLIDVREPSEYATGHLPRAINLPRGVLEFRIHAHPALAEIAGGHLRDLPLVVYCQTGGRSALAADSLRQLGFERVSSLAGGVSAWCEAGLPLHLPATESQ